MKFKTVAPLLALALLLTSGSLNPSSVIAANPNFSVTSRLSPQEGEALFRSRFEADALFGKPNNHHSVKQIYWTPTSAEVYQAEESLAGHTEAINETCNQGIVQINPKSYDIVLTYDLRQFAGVVQGSKRLLLINGLPLSSASLDPIFMTSSLFTRVYLINSCGTLASCVRSRKCRAVVLKN